MANIKSAKKRVKVIATKTARNKAAKSALKTAINSVYGLTMLVKANAVDKQQIKTKIIAIIILFIPVSFYHYT